MDSDSDSEWEPPSKRRKLNNNKSKKTSKKIKKKRKRKNAVIHTKRRKRRRTRGYSNNHNSEDSDSGIEILWNEDEYFKSKQSNKNTKILNAPKAPKLNKKIQKNTKRKPQKQTRLKFKPVSTAVTTISNLDTLLCGIYRVSVSDHYNVDILNTFPRVVTDIIFKYQKNIMYIEVNFVWTHKHNCCYHNRSCDVLKRNRGNYIYLRDPDNVFDSNAIKIVTKTGKQVGHIPRDMAECLSPLLDGNKVDLHSVGGVKGKPCCEMVEIVPLNTLTTEDMKSLTEFLEEKPYDYNRYIHTSNDKK